LGGFSGVVSAGPLSDNLPAWGDVYSVQGTLNLPYAEIEEPFAGFYDAPNKRSRIDYYGGVCSSSLSFFCTKFNNYYYLWRQKGIYHEYPLSHMYIHVFTLVRLCQHIVALHNTGRRRNLF